MEPKPELLTALADALNAYDSAVSALIRDELESTLRPGLEAARDQAVSRLKEAYSALQLPQEQLAQTDEAIAYAESELATYQADLDSGSVSIRASARPHVNEWESELASLRAKRDQQSELLREFTAEHASAKESLAWAEIELGGYVLNLDQPFIGYGTYTESYRAFRIGSYPAWLTLLSNNTMHPEFHAFMDSLDEIAATTGYRTDDLSARLLAHAREETQAEFARDPEPVPSGKDIMADEFLAVENIRLGEIGRTTVNRIDDYRRPALPRNEVVQDFMKVPDIPAGSRRVR